MVSPSVTSENHPQPFPPLTKTHTHTHAHLDYTESHFGEVTERPQCSKILETKRKRVHMGRIGVDTTRLRRREHDTQT